MPRGAASALVLLLVACGCGGEARPVAGRSPTTALGQRTTPAAFESSLNPVDPKLRRTREGAVYDAALHATVAKGTLKVFFILDRVCSDAGRTVAIRCEESLDPQVAEDVRWALDLEGLVDFVAETHRPRRGELMIQLGPITFVRGTARVGITWTDDPQCGFGATLHLERREHLWKVTRAPGVGGCG